MKDYTEWYHYLTTAEKEELIKWESTEYFTDVGEWPGWQAVKDRVNGTQRMEEEGN